MFPRSPEHADVLPIIPEAVSVVMLAGTVAFWCHFALKSDLLTGREPPPYLGRWFIHRLKVLEFTVEDGRPFVAALLPRLLYHKTICKMQTIGCRKYGRTKKWKSSELRRMTE